MMIPQDAKISELLDHHGWEVVEKRDISYLWVTEIWLIRSKWSPTDCVAYLSFEVDPQDDPNAFKSVSQVKATRSRPLDWSRDEGVIETSDDSREFASWYLGRGEDKGSDGFFNDLSKIREECGN